MESAILKLAMICFFVTGLSHVVRPKAWAQLFILMHRKGEAGSFLNALLHFPLGVLIVSFHNVWHGLPAVLTVLGWGLVLKSLVYFIFPGHGTRMLARVSLERAWEFTIAGIFSMAISGLLMFALLSR